MYILRGCTPLRFIHFLRVGDWKCMSSKGETVWMHVIAFFLFPPFGLVRMICLPIVWLATVRTLPTALDSWTHKSGDYSIGRHCMLPQARLPNLKMYEAMGLFSAALFPRIPWERPGHPTSKCMKQWGYFLLRCFPGFPGRDRATQPQNVWSNGVIFCCAVSRDSLGETGPPNLKIFETLW